LGPKLENKTIVIGDCWCVLAKYYQTALRVRGNVPASDSFACIGAGTARGRNSETCAFDAISI